MSNTIFLSCKNFDLKWHVSDQKRITKAKEVCILLGWDSKDVSRIVQSKVSPDHRLQKSFGEVGKPPWYIDESGVLELIFQSNKTDLREQILEKIQTLQKEIAQKDAIIKSLEANRLCSQVIRCFIVENFVYTPPKNGKWFSVLAEEYYPRFKEWFSLSANRFPGVIQPTPQELLMELKKTLPTQDNKTNAICFAECNGFNDIFNARLIPMKEPRDNMTVCYQFSK